MQLEDPEHVKTFTIGKQLVYSLAVESHYPGHQDGIPKLLDLIKNLNNESMEDIKQGDTRRMFTIIISKDQSHLLHHILNNPYIPGSHYTDAVVRTALKEAIRVGSNNILNLFIENNVPILSDQNKFADIKSLIFTILKSIQIGYYKNKANNVIIANTFWNYMSSSIYHLYHSQNENQHTTNASPNKIDNAFSKNWNNEMKKYGDDIGINEGKNDELDAMRSCKFMVQNALVINSIYKYVTALSGYYFAATLFPVLQFLCEHYYTFDDAINLDELHGLCTDGNDKLFDCSRLSPFALSSQSALQQIGRNSDNSKFIEKNKNSKVYVKLFWSEYVLVRLINDFLGIDVHKIKNKRSQKNVQLSSKSNDVNDDGQSLNILDCIRYIISNGAAQHLSDVILPLIDNYKSVFCSDNENDNVNMEILCSAIKCGENIWGLKTMQTQEVLKLFDNICNNSIQLPLHVISFIISFVVL